jgi:ligand-binding sensor domain-containing protein
MALYTAKSVIILFLTTLACSCNVQDIRNEATKKPLQTPNGTPDPILVYKSKEQISQVVRMMVQDSKGNIWFGAENGAWKLTGQTLIHIDSIKSESGQGITIKDITEDKDGTIWIGHTDGISSIRGETVTNYYESDGLISNDVWNISSDTDGKIWIGTTEGACVFDGKTFTNIELPLGIRDTTVGVSSEKMVNRIFQDRKGTIWIASNAGLFSYSNNKLTDASKDAESITNFAGIGFEDKAGVLWITSKEGLFAFKDGVTKKITDEHIEIGKGIGSIAEDKYGRIWFVVNQHYLYTYDGKKVTEFIKSEENKGPVIFQIYKDQSDRMWFVGYGGAYRLENGRFINITKDGPW